MPDLDYANPIHTFSDGNTWTATQDCWLCGGITGSNSGYWVKIRDNYIAQSGHSYSYLYMPPLKIRKNDTVQISPSSSAFHALAEI